MTTITMPDGRIARLEPIDGPPTEPGVYLAEYTPRTQLFGLGGTAERHTIAREVRIDGTGCLDHGPDSARLEWWARIVFEAPGGGLIRGATADGDANDQRGEGAGSAEPSTPGREVASLLWASPEYVDRVLARARQCDAMEAERDELRATLADLNGYCAAVVEHLMPKPSTPGREGEPDWWAAVVVPRVEFKMLLDERDELRDRVVDLERALADADGCRQLALRRAEQAEAERDELRTKVTDAAVIAVAFDHEFRAIAKALGLGPSATAGEIAETVVGLRDRVNGLEAAHRWVPVNQRLPPLGEDVLVWSPGWTAATQGYRTTRDVFVSMDEVDMPSATHWRPIPAGPEVQP